MSEAPPPAFFSVHDSTSPNTRTPSAASSVSVKRQSDVRPTTAIATATSTSIVVKPAAAATVIHNQDDQVRLRTLGGNNHMNTTSHQHFLYQNGKTPVAERQSLDFSYANHIVGSTTPGFSQPYPGPAALPFTPVPIQQSIATHDLAPGFGAFALDINNSNLNAAARQMYTASIAKLKAQLSDAQRQLAAKSAECDAVRRDLSLREREAASDVLREVRSRVDAERAQLLSDHGRVEQKTRDHYESQTAQLHDRVRSAEAEAEQLRLRVASMTSEVAAATAASQRDKSHAEALQRRYEGELSTLREHRDKESDTLRRELETARLSTDGRDRSVLQQVASLQADVRRLQSELEQTRGHEARLQAERDEDSRRHREEREAAQRESELAVRKAHERAKIAESECREALDRALRCERQLSDERSRRERLQEENVALETREHEAVRALARREAEIARLEARAESLTVKANAYATEAAAVRHEFEVRDSRDRAEEKMSFDQKLIAFRDRTAIGVSSSSDRRGGAAGGSMIADRSFSSSRFDGGLMPTPSAHQRPRSRFSSLYSGAAGAGASPSVETQNVAAGVNSSFSGGSGGGALSAFQEALETTQSEIRDLKRCIAQIATLPRAEFAQRGGPRLETQLESAMQELNRLNERVSRQEAATLRHAHTTVNQQQRQMQDQQQRLQQHEAEQRAFQTAAAHSGAARRAQQATQQYASSSAAATPVKQQQQQQQPHAAQRGALVADMSPAMKSIEALRNDLLHGANGTRR